MSNIRPSFIVLIISLFLFGSIAPAFGQGTGYLEDESDYLWDEQQYQDSSGREFETSDSQYVGEQEIKEQEEAARRSGRPTVDLAAALEKDKELLPDNIIYGIGTGAVLGGWLALVQGKNARDNIRFLSVGVISGVLLGMAVGSKSLYIQQGQPISHLNHIGKDPGETSKALPIQLGFTQQKNKTLPQLQFQFKF